MKAVLIDMHLAEAYCAMVHDSLHKPGAKNYDSLQVYYKRIFDHHKISRQQFEESTEWYKAHPADLDSMYADMLGTVNTMQQRSNSRK